VSLHGVGDAPGWALMRDGSCQPFWVDAGGRAVGEDAPPPEENPYAGLIAPIAIGFGLVIVIAAVTR